MTNPHDTASAALRYIDRGWAVVALHDVATGVCSCGSADPEHAAGQGGKHPVAKGWQNAGLRTSAAVADAWARRPGANIGIVTGRASGIWVLDVDPLHGGDKQLAALVAAYGPLPETYTVRTGSGGRHYYWAMPDFDFTTSRGRLPVGLDVRGNAGQVVAPPSYTLRGSYQVLVDVAVAAAPAWLLGLIKPEERPEPIERSDAAAWTQPQGVAGRGAAYARVAVRELLGQLTAAQPGERNVTAYRVGRRLAELVASPWAELNGESVAAWYLDAAARCDVDGGFSQTEALNVLHRAIRDQGGRGVDLPAPDHLGTRTDWVPPSDFDQAGQDPAPGGGVFTSPGQLINGPSEQAVVAPVVDEAYEQAVRYEMGRQLVRAEAARRLAERDQRRTDFGAEFISGEQLAALPAAVVLIDGYLDMDTLARINGPSGHGKSFVTLDMGASVSTGRHWHGCAVTRAEVWYVLGEGATGMAKRDAAWCARAGIESTGIRYLARALQVDGPEWPAFVAYAQKQRPGLIILDTQARMTVGVKENDAAEMGVVVAALDELRAASGACVTLVHHRGLQGEHGRGSTAVRGALASELDVSKTGMTLTVKVMKQKDQVERPPLLLTMNQLAQSIVLVGEHDAAQIAGTPFSSPVNTTSKADRQALAVINVLMETDASGETYSRVRTRAFDRCDFGSTPSGRTGTFSRTWARLIDLGRIAKAQGREAFYFIELEGVSNLAPNPGKTVQGGPEVYEG